MALQGKTGICSTLETGSDELNELKCDSCINENRQEEAKGYCVNCAQNICNDCIKCHKKISSLMGHIIESKPKAPKSQGGTTELDGLKNSLNELEEKLTIFWATADSIQSDVITSHSNVVKQIKDWRADVNKVIDDLENKLLERASALKQQSISNLGDSASAYKNLITETNSLTQTINQNRLHKSVKETQAILSKMQQQAEGIGEQCKSQRLSFDRHENVATMLSSLGLGTVSLSGGDPADIQATYEREIDVKSKTDTQECKIQGATVLSDGRLCLCDWNNKSIKLIDTKLFKISEELVLPNAPCDATVISDGEIAVNIGDHNLQILSVSPTLKHAHTIRLPSTYNGIAYSDNKLILAWWYNRKQSGGIDICDMTGNRIKRIETNVDDSKILTCPKRICVSPDDTMMYVSDQEAHTVVCMNMDGDVINIYRNEKLQTPNEITVDKEGNVYVCSRDNHTIHQLTRTGQLIQVLLDEKEGVKFPVAIVHRSGHLYISSGSATQALRNNIKGFRLSNKW